MKKLTLLWLIVQSWKVLVTKIFWRRAMNLYLLSHTKKKWKYNFLHLQNVVMFISYTILQIYVFKLRVINFNTGWVRNVPKIICDVCSLAISQILLTLNAYLIYHLLWIAKTNVYLCIVTNFQNWITWYLDLVVLRMAPWMPFKIPLIFQII